jgi:uncharacterized SAM-binding protein YcdF (DUF218 family)
MMTAGFVLLVASNVQVSYWVLRPFENRYAPIPDLTAGQVPAELARCRFVVVLGSGNGNSPGRSALNQLSDSASRRLAEAVRILRVLPEAKLLLSGPPEGAHASHATVLARAAISLGVDPGRIVLSEQVRDTEDESLAVKQRAGDLPVALVTTAWHMPRAMALFRHAGVTAVACPTDYRVQDNPEWTWTDLLWDLGALDRTTAAVRETLGNLWIRLRGKV